METVGVNLSVVVITLNEQDNILRCLASIPKGAEVIVVDSGSVDLTCSIARDFGARVIENPFLSYSQQKNFACSFATRKWILSVDADEELDERLREEIVSFCKKDSSSSEILAYRVKRKLVFLGKIMNFGKSSDHPIRIFSNGGCHFVGDIHEKIDIRACQVASFSKGIIYHHSFRNLTDYFNRFNIYTTKIAEERFRNKRRASWSQHLLRPWSEFIARYIFRLGFMDGYAGYSYALISSLYTYIKYAKYFEMVQNERKKS